MHLAVPIPLPDRASSSGMNPSTVPVSQFAPGKLAHVTSHSASLLHRHHHLFPDF